MPYFFVEFGFWYLHPRVADLQHCEGVRLAPQVRRIQALRFEHLHHQVANILDLL